MVAPDDIPRALSEEGDGTCGLTVWPDFLADCDTPLSSNAVDIRGGLGKQQSRRESQRGISKGGSL